jgi:hypothetical protein
MPYTITKRERSVFRVGPRGRIKPLKHVTGGAKTWTLPNRFFTT